MAAGNRKKATDFILTYIDKLLPDSENKSYYETRLKSMSDDEFAVLMDRLEAGELILPLVAPNGADQKLSVERNLEIAKELDYDFFQHLVLTDPDSGTTYKTPKKYLVIDLPLRRQAQLLKKKISIPEDNQHIDDMSGQPTGPSKGAKLSFPELQILDAQGLSSPIEELIKFRGGDTKAYSGMLKSIQRTGGVSQKAIKDVAPTKVKSTQTLRAMLLAMHLDNNL